MVADNILILSSFVKISKKRQKVMASLDGDVKIPRDISKDTEIPSNQISKILYDLKEKNLIECINEEVRKGRLYRLTPLGNEVQEYISTGG